MSLVHLKFLTNSTKDVLAVACSPFTWYKHHFCDNSPFSSYTFQNKIQFQASSHPLLFSCSECTLLISITRILLKPLFCRNHYTRFHLWQVGWVDYFLLLLVWNTVNYLRKNREYFASAGILFTWIISIFCITLFSSEIRNLFIWANYSGVSSLYHNEIMFDKAGLTIVWAVS